MSTHTVNMHEAKTNLSKLVAEAEEGNEVIIARRGKPVVRLSKVEEQPVRQLNIAPGEFEILPGFDDPIPEFDGPVFPEI